MSSVKKNFGDKSLGREIRIGISILILLVVAGLSIWIGAALNNGTFDTRDEAAGKTYFIESTQNLQNIIDNAKDSDAIFLKVGTYSTSNSNGFSIKNKNIRILGAGKDFVKVSGANNSYVFHVNDSNVSFESLKIDGANKDGVFIENKGQRVVTLRDTEVSNNSGAGIRTDSKTIVSTSLIDQNGSGIESSGELTVENSAIQNSSDIAIHIAVDTKTNTKIQNVIVSKNKGKGIYIEGGKNSVIKNVTLVGNDAGIVETTNSTTNVSNTIVQDSKNEGISLKGTNSTVKFSNSFGNAGGNYIPEAFKSAEGNLSVDSKFVSDSDFHLVKAESALFNKGNTAEKNADNSRIDIGAFGGNPNLSVSNSAPKISSIPPKFVKPGERYFYEVKATDPDNDSLTYIIANSNYPKWIKLEGNKLSGVPSTTDVGFSGIILIVTDKKGHNIVHPVSINVIPSSRPVPSENPVTTPVPTQQPKNPEVPKLSILAPKANTVFNKDSNEIKWQVTNNVDVESFTIKYSDDKQNFKTVTTVPGSTTNYLWKDVEKLTPGKYILQIEATDKGNPQVVVKELSEEFEVKNTPPATNPQNVTITKNSPADNDVVSNKKPLVVVEFKPDVELDQTKTYIKINGEEVKYETRKNTIYYEPKEDLKGSIIKVETKLVTKDNSQASKTWVFNLPVNPSPQNPNPVQTDESTILGLPRTWGLIVIGVIVLGLLLLALYFVVKLIKTIRDERQGNLDAEFTEYYEPQASPLPQPTDYQAAATTAAIASTISEEMAKESPVQTEYIAAPDPNSEYYVEEALIQPVLPIQTVSETVQPVDYQQPQASQTIQPINQEYVPASQDLESFANTQTTEPSSAIEQEPSSSQAAGTDTTSTTDFASSSQSQGTANQAPIQAQNDVTGGVGQTQSTVTNTTSTGAPNDLGTQSTATSSGTQDDSGTQSTTTAASDPYIEELKKKYGITDVDIENYKKNEESGTDKKS